MVINMWEKRKMEKCRDRELYILKVINYMKENGKMVKCRDLELNIFRTEFDMKDN